MAARNYVCGPYPKRRRCCLWTLVLGLGGVRKVSTVSDWKKSYVYRTREQLITVIALIGLWVLERFLAGFVHIVKKIIFLYLCFLVSTYFIFNCLICAICLWPNDKLFNRMNQLVFNFTRVIFCQWVQDSYLISSYKSSLIADYSKGIAKTCSFVDSIPLFQHLNLSACKASPYYVHLSSSHFMYCFSFSKCGMFYIGEIGR